VDTWYFGLLVAILGISLFFSAANFALKAYSRMKLEDLLTHRGNEDHLEIVQEDMHRLLLTSAVIRTSANLALVLAIANGLSQGVLHLPILVYAFLISIVLLSVFSVAIPYAWARYSAEPFLAATLPFLRAVKLVMTPLIAFMDAIDLLVRRLAGVSIEPEGNHAVEQEILEAVHEGEEEGVVDSQERRMIESVIETRSVTVGQVMTPRTEMVAVAADASLDQLKLTIQEHGHSRLPVYEESLDNIIGMLYVKDLLQFLDTVPNGFSIRDVMRPCYFVPETKLLRSLFSEFRHKKIHVAIVLDEYGGTLGLVTFEDLIEEIVGDITDEYEPAEPPLIKELDSKTLQIDARMRTDDLNDEYELNLPESEDYETIGGFIFSSLGRIPVQGETFQYQNLLFTVLDASERKIGHVRLEILPEEVVRNEANGAI